MPESVSPNALGGMLLEAAGAAKSGDERSALSARNEAVLGMRSSKQALQQLARVDAGLKRVAAPTARLARHLLVMRDGRVAPVLRQPAFLDRECGVPARVRVRSVLRHAPGQRAITSILESADLGTSPVFQTVLNTGSARMQGPGDRTLGHVEGVAHELAHCLHARLVETTRQPVDALRQEVCEEWAALTLGELVVAVTLDNPTEREQWHRHQRRTDSLAYECYLIERAELLGEPPPAVSFDPGLLVLRPSYVLLPGYEMIYALASALRSSELAATGPDVASLVEAMGTNCCAARSQVWDGAKL